MSADRSWSAVLGLHQADRLAPTATVCPSIRNGSRSAASIRWPISSASAARCSTSTANSSPPSRATRSLAAVRSRAAVPRSRAAAGRPIACPKLSLISLKSSRSAKSSATGRPCCWCASSATTSRSRNSARLARPVSGSWYAWWCSRCWPSETRASSTVLSTMVNICRATTRPRPSQPRYASNEVSRSAGAGAHGEHHPGRDHRHVRQQQVQPVRLGPRRSPARPAGRAGSSRPAPAAPGRAGSRPTPRGVSAPPVRSSSRRVSVTPKASIAGADQAQRPAVGGRRRPGQQEQDRHGGQDQIRDRVRRRDAHHVRALPHLVEDPLGHRRPEQREHRPGDQHAVDDQHDQVPAAGHRHRPGQRGGAGQQARAGRRPAGSGSRRRRRTRRRRGPGRRRPGPATRRAAPAQQSRPSAEEQPPAPARAGRVRGPASRQIHAGRPRPATSWVALR